MATPPVIITSVRNPADVINAALVRIGYKLRVGSLYDGSRAAADALDMYGQTRDQMMRDGDWGFARRDVALTLLKSAPPGGYVPPTQWDAATNPPLPWLYEYEVPSDYLKIRALKPSTLFVPNFNPGPITFALKNDNGYTPAALVLLCNTANALLTYTGRVTDPTTWEASFTEGLVAEIARRLTPGLIGSLDAVKTEAADEQASVHQAAMVQG